jgi:hypothetical protein
MRHRRQKAERTTDSRGLNGTASQLYSTQAERYTFRPVLMKFTPRKRAGALPCETGAT